SGTPIPVGTIFSFVDAVVGCRPATAATPSARFGQVAQPSECLEWTLSFSRSAWSSSRHAPPTRPPVTGCRGGAHASRLRPRRGGDALPRHLSGGRPGTAGKVLRPRHDHSRLAADCGLLRNHR